MPVFCPEYRAQSECCAPSFPSVFLSSSHLPRRAVPPLRPSCGLSAACLPRNICSISFSRAKFNLFTGSVYISFFRGATRYAYRDRRCGSGCNCTFGAQTECTGIKEKSALFLKGQVENRNLFWGNCQNHPISVSPSYLAVSNPKPPFLPAPVINTVSIRGYAAELEPVQAPFQFFAFQSHCLIFFFCTGVFRFSILEKNYLICRLNVYMKVHTKFSPERALFHRYYTFINV